MSSLPDHPDSLADKERWLKEKEREYNDGLVKLYYEVDGKPSSSWYQRKIADKKYKCEFCEGEIGEANFYWRETIDPYNACCHPCALEKMDP